ncbi:FAD-dependent oxidoreductase [Paramesorhizobium deserti]|uniref:FAD-dependent oxidoreductase n=1 Tax=Paramesorhizobium deserti TaxID=1494590 RepID=A0A135HQK0_9HYPH|nr:FAD-binding oxidoreductase [Paramesorhizobium deserti]KXF75462.1 FAD-dependent oxidoreductase [Paramesorhizobium deserti]
MLDPASSLWAATADPAPATPALEGAHTADVVVIGAGYTGLTAALSLTEGGASVIVADMVGPGFGASGRNGGQVIPGLKLDPDVLDAVFGEATTDFAGRTADTVFSLIEKHRIECEPIRQGWIQGSVKKSHLPTLEKRMLQWQSRGAPVEMLDAQAMKRRTGGIGFVGGWIDMRAGSIHPLNYARGLASAALAAGIKVHGNSEATELKRNGSRWAVMFSNGAKVVADNVVIATNGYSSSLWPGLKATVIPANSFQIATAPLDSNLLERILPERSAVSDSRRVGNYFRIGPGDRLMMGGRGSFSDPRSPADYHRIVGALHAFFPEVRSVSLEFRWTGRVAMTRDHLPHIHQPAPGLTMALGYNGRGVAMASALGTAIGAHLLNSTVNPLPLKLTDIKPLPLHDLHPIYASAMIAYYRLRDSLES